MKKHFVNDHSECEKGSDIIQHLKIDIENLSDVIIRSLYLSKLERFSFCILVCEKFLDKTFFVF